MSVSDPIADFLTCIRNASKAHKETVTIPSSKMKVHITELLQEEGFIKKYVVVEEGVKKALRIYLKYMKDKKPAIKNLKKISKPGLRRYTEAHKIPRVMSGLGLIVMSTSMGVISGEKARKENVGGEIVCKVW